MKPAGTLLLLSIGWVTTAPAAESSTGIISREISAKIREGLPAYTPPASQPGREATDPPPQTTDPNVLILPKLTVTEKRLPSDAADHLMSKRDFKRKMENLYLDTLAEDGPLNVLLNRFTIPILSPSKAERGRAIYTRKELDRLGHINRASQTITPDAAKKFKDELDNTHTTRPAGGLEKR
jgi:hypothetical protein